VAAQATQKGFLKGDHTMEISRMHQPHMDLHQNDCYLDVGEEEEVDDGEESWFIRGKGEESEHNIQ
jgi:hypothetical protein